MPVIHTHVSVPTTPEQREALKAAYGKAITVVAMTSPPPMWKSTCSAALCRALLGKS